MKQTPPRQLDASERAIIYDEALRDGVRNELATSRAAAKTMWQR
jgi:hypothetical protein